MVVGRVGEQVDAGLLHQLPLGVADVSAGELLQSRDVGRQALALGAAHRDLLPVRMAVAER
jgi:hypothetical protein